MICTLSSILILSSLWKRTFLNALSWDNQTALDLFDLICLWPWRSSGDPEGQGRDPSRTVLAASTYASLHLTVRGNEVVVYDDEVLELREHLVAETRTIRDETWNMFSACCVLFTGIISHLSTTQIRCCLLATLARMHYAEFKCLQLILSVFSSIGLVCEMVDQVWPLSLIMCDHYIWPQVTTVNDHLTMGFVITRDHNNMW